MNLHYHIVKHEFTLSYCKTRILHYHIVKHEFTLYCKTQILHFIYHNEDI